MYNFKDLSGQKINFWNIISRAENSGISTRYNCICDCGTERIVRAAHLTSNASKSCGCKESEIKSHGAARKNNFTKKYRTWRQMCGRCLNPKHKNADIYYGLLCDEWKDFNSFNSYMPEPSDDSLTIDRIENSKGYEPGNVRWVTMAEQHRNQSNCRWIEFNGKKQLLTDWAKELGISDSSLHRKIKIHGIELALTSPAGKQIAPAWNKRVIINKDGIINSLTGWAKFHKVSTTTIYKWMENGSL